MTIPTAQAFLFQAPTGVPGDIVVSDESNSEPIMLQAVSSVYAQAFGIPLAYAVGGASQFQSSNVAADFAGVLVREAPGIGGNANQGLYDAIPNPVQPQGIMVRGYVNVLCPVGTPARGGIVYICVNTGGGGAIGDFQASSNAYNVALSTTQAEWALDGKDSSNNTVLRIAR